jgi:large subunit ribosomal protein L25
MAGHIPLPAASRDRVGKGAARAARRADHVPGVIYGGGQTPVPISVPAKELNKLVHDPAFFTHIYDIDVSGTKIAGLARDVQFHPLTDRPIHVDFLRVTDATRIRVAVPVKFQNELASPGLKRGGVLNIVRHEIELFCTAGQIPEHLDCDLTGFEINDSIHMSHIPLPNGVTPVIQDRDFTVATVTAPSALKSAEQEQDQAAAPAAAAAAPAAKAPAKGK